MSMYHPWVNIERVGDCIICERHGADVKETERFAVRKAGTVTFLFLGLTLAHARAAAQLLANGVDDAPAR